MTATRCDFHDKPNGSCIHCLGYELVFARADIARLHDWIAHLVNNAKPTKGHP